MHFYVQITEDFCFCVDWQLSYFSSCLIPNDLSSFIHQAYFSGYSLLVAIRTAFTAYHIKHPVCRNSRTILLWRWNQNIKLRAKISKAITHHKRLMAGFNCIEWFTSRDSRSTCAITCLFMKSSKVGSYHWFCCICFQCSFIVPCPKKQISIKKQIMDPRH